MTSLAIPCLLADARRSAPASGRAAGVIALQALGDLLLVLLNGFFVAAEFALVKVRGSQLERWSRRATSARRWRSTCHRQSRCLSFRQPARHHAGQPRPRLGRRAVPRADARAALFQARHRQSDDDHPRDLVRARLSRSSPSCTSCSASRRRRFSPSASRCRPRCGSAGRCGLFYVIFKPAIWFLNASSNWLLKPSFASSR